MVHFDTHTDTGAEVFGAERRTGRRCAGWWRRATSTPPLRRRSACAATGPASASSPGRPSAGSRACSCTTCATSASARSSPARSPRVGPGPVFLTVDVDVLDPAFIPGTGTPEPGGMTRGRPAPRRPHGGRRARAGRRGRGRGDPDRHRDRGRVGARRGARGARDAHRHRDAPGGRGGLTRTRAPTSLFEGTSETCGGSGIPSVASGS